MRLKEIRRPANCSFGECLTPELGAIGAARLSCCRDGRSHRERLNTTARLAPGDFADESLVVG